MRKSNTRVRWKQSASQPTSASLFYEIVLSCLRKIRNISSGIAPILRVPSDRTGKSEALASDSLYKICRTRHAETFAIGNEKVRTSSSAEIQFRYRTTIYSDILPLENRSYMNQGKERDEFIFRPSCSSSFETSVFLTMRKFSVS